VLDDYKIYRIVYFLKTLNNIEDLFQNSDQLIYPIVIEKKDNIVIMEMYIEKVSSSVDNEKINNIYLVITFKTNNEDENNRIQYERIAAENAKKFISILDIMSPYEPTVEKDITNTKYTTNYQQRELLIQKTSKTKPAELDAITRFFTEELILKGFSVAKTVFEVLNSKIKKSDYLFLAFKYYSNSKYYRSSIESRDFDEIKLEKEFLDLLFCMECLFNEGPSDIYYKISIRSCLVYYLLPVSDEDILKSTDLYDFIKQSYTKRNNIVHGKGEQEITILDIEKLKKIVFRLLIGIFILCLIFRASKELKKDIIKEIDYCAIDYERKQKLKEKCEEIDLYNIK
jgi:hypothetical protein